MNEIEKYTIKEALRDVEFLYSSLAPYSMSPVFGRFVLRLGNLRRYLLTVSEDDNETSELIRDLRDSVIAIFKIVDEMQEDATMKDLKVRLKEHRP